MAGNDLLIELEEVPDRNLVVMHLTGRIDSRTCNDLQEELEILFGNGVCRVILNLEAIDYFSSAGLGLFINVSVGARERNGNIVLMSPSKCILQLLHLIGVHDELSIAHDYQSAVRLLS
ncbi:MAG TPA: STAS domain-containing protein [Planctomycetota bacterium]|nr:STAS domain-containing protein [Planctomycetota bacterium]